MSCFAYQFLQFFSLRVGFNALRQEQSRWAKSRAMSQRAKQAGEGPGTRTDSHLLASLAYCRFVRQRLYSCHQRWGSARGLTVFLQWGHWQTVNTGQFFAHSVHGFIFAFICTIIFTYGSVHATREKFENAALFLRLGLPSTLIRHENGAFRKRSSIRRNLKTAAFRFSVDGKHF